MNKLQNIKAVIFDLDGTLVDTEYHHWQAWRQAVLPYNIQISKDDYIKNLAGNTANFIEDEFVKKHKLTIKKGSISQVKDALILKWMTEKKLSFMPYAVETLDFFNKLGLKMGLASGGAHLEVQVKLERLSLKKYFSHCISRNDVKRGKPYPDSYILTAKKLNVDPKDCLVFEDTSYGVRSAKSAGCVCVAVPCEYSLHQDFSMADYVFKDLSEVFRLNGRLGKEKTYKTCNDN